MTAGRSVGPAIAGLVVWGGLGAALLLVLGGHVFGLPPLGDLLDPADGLYRTARRAVPPAEAEVSLPALDAPVTVLLDDRGVPHIFASSDRDAVVAFGYVTARDRLFQLDFLPRVASGRLSELFGPASIGADRFLRRTGMELGARRNAVRIIEEDGIERRLVQWFADGVNAYVDALAPEDLPFEFRLLGVKPDRYTVLHAARLMQYFAYDLTYRTDVAGYGQLRSQLAPEDYALLYPHHSRLFVPIIPEAGGGAAPQQTAGNAPAERAGAVLARLAEEQAALRGTAAEGFVHGKGSNNWVVGGARSATGRPILAGDMHLRLTLPSIWYEAHLVSPSMNSYGVAAPGTPLPIEAFTEQLAWAFTNTGADVIDHYALDVDRQRMCYRYQDTCRPLEAVPDTIRVRGGEAVIDTLYYSHFGPVMLDDSGAVAVRWVAHDTSRTLQALWHMHHADDLDAFADALTRWDTPAQNIVQADTGGAIAIRSTGYLPIRRAGHGRGLLDGTGDAFEWIGRIPFEELPQSRNPDQGFLTSTNQQPADSTYPYYLGHDWRDSYRSLRIDTLLRARATHRTEDLMAYQADVHAVQRDLFVPFLDTLGGLPARADTLRRLLSAWDGATTVDRPEPLILDVFLDLLEDATWDEAVFEAGFPPHQTVIYELLRDDPTSKWFDRAATPQREDGTAVLRAVLAATADTLAARHGWGTERWRWGAHHGVLFQHLTQTPALRALWRGPYEYPGFSATLSPAGSRPTTHSASWRMVVDFSTAPPTGYGVYPGGQSGNPFSPYYDAQVDTFVGFEYYPLLNPATPEAMPEARIAARLLLIPVE